MTDEEFRKVYEKQLEEAEEYQDFVADQLRMSTPCIILSPYCSRKFQYDKGESASGIEIKHDKQYQVTGNLFIEVAEKTKPSESDYTQSGIMRKDNTWLYLIGDYDGAYLFHKKQLATIYLNKQHWKKRGIRAAENKTKTSMGILLPIETAEKYGTVLYHFVWEH